MYKYTILYTGYTNFDDYFKIIFYMCVPTTYIHVYVYICITYRETSTFVKKVGELQEIIV